MQGLYPYPPNPLAEGISSIGQFLPLLLAFKKAQAEKQFQAQPLGTALGYPNAPVNAPTPGPIASMPGVGPTIPTASPANFLGDNITAKPNTTFTGAPAGAQPLLAQPVSTLAKLRAALGDQQTTNLMSSLGLGKKFSSDTMDLEYDPETGSFKIPEGKTNVSPKSANIILRQKDIANKKDLTVWRDTVEKRLSKGQLTREENISLRADADLLNFMVSPQFDLMDDTLKEQFKSQAAAAINRLQQRGVNAFTGSRKTAMDATKTKPKAAPALTTPPPKSPETRFNEIKAQNPTLTDQQIYAQMAIEEASGK